MADRKVLDAAISRELGVLEIMLTAKVKRTAASFEEYIAVRLSQGVSLDVIEEDLKRDLAEGGRIYNEFVNSMKSTVGGSLERLRDAGVVSELGVKTKYRWVAVLINTCPDCLSRHGKVRTWDDWEAEGLPRTGQTVCKENCKCVLLPESATEMEPIKRGG